MGDAIKPLLATKKLKTNLLSKHRGHGNLTVFEYDSVFDAFLLMVVPPMNELIVHYLDEHVGLLYEEKSREIIGLQIESFAHRFVPNHVNVQTVWRLNEIIGKRDFGEMITAVEKIKPKIIQEIFKASEPILNQASLKLTTLLKESFITNGVLTV